MIRVILPGGQILIYPDATHATPITENGYSTTNIHDGHSTLFATIVGPCVCDEGDGIVTDAEGQQFYLAYYTQKCRVCGCKYNTPCTHADGGPCSWVESDLCSVCDEQEPGSKKSNRKPHKKK